MKYLFSIVMVFLLGFSASSQNVKIITVGFYNLENLFDTEDDPMINDEEFTPEGKRSWTFDKYQEKLANMAYVISQIGIDQNPKGVAVLGVSEVENKRVLEDLVIQDAIKDRNYQIVHMDSPDRRGIDVALLYNPSQFEVMHFDTIPFIIYNSDGKRRFTRNILHIKGLLDGDTTYFLVNHWPSRSGGEARSAPNRIHGAKLVREYVDSLNAVDPNSKIIIVGDLNDDPNSASVKNYLRARTRIKETVQGELFNPMADYYRRGIGSNAYRDSWSLFDQIIVSSGLTDCNEGYCYYKAYVFNKRFLVQPSGKYKGYPFRTFGGDKYQGGYSDHFPVYAHLIQRID
ncbi:MAG: endonuclease/exonuclease/phosphatase family protein [Saprospiraceae bacterium]|nr:endonuclease/exonuclease/phosphatase family protein [Saprospiraceae bacterium]